MIPSPRGARPSAAGTHGGGRAAAASQVPRGSHLASLWPESDDKPIILWPEARPTRLRGLPVPLARPMTATPAHAARPTPEGAHIRLAMLSQPRYLSSARAAASAFARQAGFDEHASGHVALAVDEALCNVLKHGYDRREDQPIWMDLSPLIEHQAVVGIRIVIEDEAKQAPLETIRSRALEEGILRLCLD